jgi:hypothetical protein
MRAYSPALTNNIKVALANGQLFDQSYGYSSYSQSAVSFFNQNASNLEMQVAENIQKDNERQRAIEKEIEERMLRDSSA